MPQKIIAGSSNEIRVSGLHDVRTGTPLTGATITGLLKTLDGTAVQGGTITFTELGNGEYSGVLGAGAAVVKHETYEAVCTAVAGGLTRVFTEEVLVVE